MDYLTCLNKLNYEKPALL